MYRILIWGAGKEYRKYLPIIKYFERAENISVVAVMSDDKGYETIDGYRFCEKKDISTICYEFCLVTIKNFDGIKKEAQQLGIAEEKLIPARVLEIPHFSFEKYIRIKTSRISIFSRHCWGGLCYHYLALEFLSPTINMFFEDRDFNKFMSGLDFYLSLPVEFVEMRYENNLKREYPVGRIGDIRLFFNHYTSFEEAKDCWERRKKRINKENILVVSSSMSKEVAIEFDRLPFENKLIFVPKSNGLDNDSCVAVDYTDMGDGRTIGMYVNETACGKGDIIDLISLLLHEEYVIKK